MDQFVFAAFDVDHHHVDVADAKSRQDSAHVTQLEVGGSEEAGLRSALELRRPWTAYGHALEPIATCQTECVQMGSRVVAKCSLKPLERVGLWFEHVKLDG